MFDLSGADDSDFQHFSLEKDDGYEHDDYGVARLDKEYEAAVWEKYGCDSSGGDASVAAVDVVPRKAIGLALPLRVDTTGKLKGVTTTLLALPTPPPSAKELPPALPKEVIDLTQDDDTTTTTTPTINDLLPPIELNQGLYAPMGLLEHHHHQQSQHNQAFIFPEDTTTVYPHSAYHTEPLFATSTTSDAMSRSTTKCDDTVSPTTPTFTFPQPQPPIARSQSRHASPELVQVLSARRGGGGGGSVFDPSMAGWNPRTKRALKVTCQAPRRAIELSPSKPKRSATGGTGVVVAPNLKLARLVAQGMEMKRAQSAAYHDHHHQQQQQEMIVPEQTQAGIMTPNEVVIQAQFVEIQRLRAQVQHLEALLSSSRAPPPPLHLIHGPVPAEAGPGPVSGFGDFGRGPPSASELSGTTTTNTIGLGMQMDMEVLPTTPFAMLGDMQFTQEDVDLAAGMLCGGGLGVDWGAEAPPAPVRAKRGVEEDSAGGSNDEQRDVKKARH